jgi:hypothetical protein
LATAHATIALALSVALNVGLAWRLHRSRDELKQVRAAQTDRHTLKVGAHLTTLYAKGVDGRASAIRLDSNDSKGTILYLFSPDCHFCSKNLQKSHALYLAIHDKYRFVAISLKDQDVPKYVRDNHVKYDVTYGLSADSEKQLNIAATPTTVVVSPAGAVLAIWHGAYDGKTKDDVEKYFDLVLPEKT